MNNTNHLENLVGTHYCGCCRRELSLDSFYFNSQKQCFDHYCKDCRKMSSQKHRESKQRKRTVNGKKNYLVITQVEDPEERMKLIMHALKEVQASMKRKRQR